MTGRRKTKANSHHPQQQNAPRQQRQSHQVQPSDSEFDVDADELRRRQEEADRAAAARVRHLLPLPQTRGIEELNLHVLQRYNPAITRIINKAHYAVVYIYSIAAGGWEKCNIEGTLFVCAMTPSQIGSERYIVTILNRRGLENFSSELTSTEHVNDENGYIMIHVPDENGEVTVYGLWIYAEAEPSSTATARKETVMEILSCTKKAEQSRLLMEETLARHQHDIDNGIGESEAQEDDGSVPMGRQVSLRDLFGQQREQDNAWNVHMHQSPAVAQPNNFFDPNTAQQQSTQFDMSSDTEFFRSNSSFAPQQGQNWQNR